MLDNTKTLCELARDSLIKEFVSSGFNVKNVEDEYIIDLGEGNSIKIEDVYEYSPFLTLIYDEKYIVGALVFLSKNWNFYPYLHNSDAISSIIGSKTLLNSNREVVDFLLQIHRKLEIAF